MFSVYQHWDSLDTCIVGKCYPPEFFSFIKHSKTRNSFEIMAQETEEDFQSLINILHKFNVNTVRPDFPADLNELLIYGKWTPPPIAPRDYFLMIHDKFYIPNIPNKSHAWHTYYRYARNPLWPDCANEEEFLKLIPSKYHKEFFDGYKKFNIQDTLIFDQKMNFYSSIYKQIENQGNEIVYTSLDFINGCFVSRLGKDLYFGTQSQSDDPENILSQVNELFPNTRNHIVTSKGHGDSVYCPVTPGLIISIEDIPTYQKTFPDWEVVYLPYSDYEHMDKFAESMRQNKGRWFLPGFEKNSNLVDTVEYYFDEWVGQVSETVFYVNILIIDHKNIIVSSYNKQVEDACKRYGIEMHISPFRHRYFWDAGIHCITNDINRLGEEQNWFPKRKPNETTMEGPLRKHIV